MPRLRSVVVLLLFVAVGVTFGRSGATGVAIARPRAEVRAAGSPQAQDAAPGPYLGQALPGATATLFAPGIVSTGLFERDLTVSPDGREIYWNVSTVGHYYSTILVSRLAGGRWTDPEVAPHMGDSTVLHIEPAISPDGSRFFFTNVGRSKTGAADFSNADIWVMERQGETWGAPKPIGAPINTGDAEFFPSPTRSGNLYFTREARGGDGGIYRARMAEGRYLEPERLPVQVNAGKARFNAFADPDERFLIVPVQGRADSLGGVDYYVVFRDANDQWSEPVNLGPAVNTADSGEYSASVSPDGRCLFFMATRTAAPWGAPSGPQSGAPPTLTREFLRRFHDSPRNGNADIWWIDAALIGRKR